MRTVVLRKSMLGLPPMGTVGEVNEVEAEPIYRHGSLLIKWADGTTNIVPSHWTVSSALELLAMEADAVEDNQ